MHLYFDLRGAAIRRRRRRNTANIHWSMKRP
jgi:hypothetical protein